MSIEAMKMALDALDCLIYDKPYAGRFADALIGLRTAIQQAEAQQPATGEPVKAERDQLRCAQADAVMPLIGTLLDAWENADREVMSQEPELSKQLKNINSAMEDAQPATGEPVGQVSDLFHSVRNKLHAKGFDSDAPLYTRPAPSVPGDDFDLICNAIDKADTITMEGDYMLDSDDCIAVVRVMQVLLSVRAAMLAAKGSK